MPALSHVALRLGNLPAMWTLQKSHPDHLWHKAFLAFQHVGADTAQNCLLKLLTKAPHHIHNEWRSWVSSWRSRKSKRSIFRSGFWDKISQCSQGPERTTSPGTINQSITQHKTPKLVFTFMWQRYNYTTHAWNRTCNRYHLFRRCKSETYGVPLSVWDGSSGYQTGSRIG